MQGQRGIVGSFSETMDFDHGSASAGTILDPQICWNNMRNPTDNRLGDFMLSPSHMNNTYANPIDQERQTLSGWSLGEPSSSRAQIEISHDEQKLEHGWSSSTNACSGVGPRLEERQYEPSNIISLDTIGASPQCLQSSNAEAGTRLNLNAGFVGHGGDNCQVSEAANLYKDALVGHEQILPASGSDSFLLSSGSGVPLEENDGRPGCSSDRRRQSCKRKAVEGNIGQSSTGGSSSFFQHSGSSSWPRVPANYGSGSNLSISPPSETVNPRLGLGLRALTTESVGDPAVGRAESSHRNFRLRINPSNQESPPLPSFSTGSAVRRPSGSSSHWSSRPLQVDPSMEFRSSLAIDSPNPLCEPVVNPVAALPQEAHSTRWNGNSSLRIGSFSNPITVGDGEEGSSRSMARSLWEHPVFVPATELRTSVRNPTNRSVTSRNSTVSGNVASTSRSGSSSGVHPSLAPTWVPHPNPPSRNSRRLAEYVRRSLFSSINSESGGPSSSQSLPSGPPASTDETVLSSGSGPQTLHRSYPRLASWMERQGDDVLGVPYPLRTLSASGEGRNRLVVSEHIRNVLDLMRRGEGLRFEDVMILDQSVLFGMTDIHDRHRDMRLDVDNMSYEELLALEERIGNVSTGLSEETILSRLKQRKCYIAAGAEVEAEPCCICQEEYKDGEDLGTLDCQHDFHSHCIKQWLMHKNWCPICKTTGLAT